MRFAIASARAWSSAGEKGKLLHGYVDKGLNGSRQT
ncbi:hypothetical protein M2444_004342 [Paenibacillus sp. PastF-3]|nr:hypothetical protein [Paenibacillus sp. PastF-3]